MEDWKCYFAARDAEKGQEAVAMLKREGVVARFHQTKNGSVILQPEMRRRGRKRWPC